MTREDIIRMAREAGVLSGYESELFQRFAALVAAAERNRIADESKHIIKRAEQRGAEIEREACAKVCEGQIKSYMSKRYTTDPLGGFRERFAAEQCAAAIRARGKE